MRAILPLAVVLLLGSPAMAEDEPEIDCENAEAQQEMNWCAARDYEAADAELNAVWKKVVQGARDADKDLAEMGDDGRPGYEETLRKSQRAWIGYRDAWCDYSGFEARGGTLEPLLVSSCLADLTRARTKELTDSLEGLGN